MTIDRRVICALLLATALLAGCDVSNGAPPTPNPARPAVSTTQPQITFTTQPAPTQAAPVAPGTAYPGPGIYPAPTTKP
jgi:hypothetical protein